MKKIFDMKNPVFRFMGNVFDLIYLNFLYLVASLPIATMGAALSSLHHVTYKILKGQEPSISKVFIQSFKQNWKQGTVLFLTLILPLLIVTCDIAFLIFSEDIADLLVVQLLKIVLGAVCFLILCTAVSVFTVQAIFENSVRNHIKNALLLSLRNLPKTVFILLFQCAYWMLALWSIFSCPTLTLFFLIFGAALPVNFSMRVLLPELKQFMPVQSANEATEG